MAESRLQTMLEQNRQWIEDWLICLPEPRQQEAGHSQGVVPNRRSSMSCFKLGRKLKQKMKKKSANQVGYEKS